MPPNYEEHYRYLRTPNPPIQAVAGVTIITLFLRISSFPSPQNPEKLGSVNVNSCRWADCRDCPVVRLVSGARCQDKGGG